MAKVKNKVSKALQDTVAEHEHIEHVHFDKLGNHYFTAHEFNHVKIKTGDTDKDAAINKRGAAMDGKMYARIHRRTVIDKEGKESTLSAPDERTEIVETAERQDILDATPESNLSLAGLSEEEMKIIQKVRSKGGKSKAAEGE